MTFFSHFATPAPLIPTKDQVCENVDCAADFDRCADFDEAQCSGCDVSFEHLENVVLKDRVSPLSYPLDGVHKPCNDLTISFTLTTDADFSASTLYRTIFRFSKTTTSTFPADARPSIAIVPDTNRILFSNNPYSQSLNRWATVDWYIWGIGNPINPSSTSTGEIISGDMDLVIEPNQVYEFILRISNNEVILNIYLPGTSSESEARIDFSYGDYLCENYMDVLAVFGQDGENVAATVSDFAAYGLCPVPEPSVEEQFCCKADFCDAEDCDSVFDPCDNFDEYECSEGCDAQCGKTEKKAGT